MANGLAVYDASGVLEFDTSEITGTLLDVIVLGSGTASSSKNYPDWTGYTIYVIRQYIQDATDYTEQLHDVDITYPSGVPTVTWTKLTSPAKQSQVLVLVN